MHSHGSIQNSNQSDEIPPTTKSVVLTLSDELRTRYGSTYVGSEDEGSTFAGSSSETDQNSSNVNVANAEPVDYTLDAESTSEIYSDIGSEIYSEAEPEISTNTRTATLQRNSFQSLYSLFKHIVNHPSMVGTTEIFSASAITSSAAALTEFSGRLQPSIARPMMLSTALPTATFALKYFFDRFDPEKKYLVWPRVILSAGAMFFSTFIFTLKVMLEIYILVATEAGESTDDINGKYSDLVLGLVATGAAGISAAHVLLRANHESLRNKLRIAKIQACQNEKLISSLELRLKISHGILSLFDGLIFSNLTHASISMIEQFLDVFSITNSNRSLRYAISGGFGVGYAGLSLIFNRESRENSLELDMALALSVNGPETLPHHYPDTAGNILNLFAMAIIAMSWVQTLMRKNGIGELLDNEDIYILATTLFATLVIPTLTELFTQLGISNVLQAVKHFVGSFFQNDSLIFSDSTSSIEPTTSSSPENRRVIAGSSRRRNSIFDSHESESESGLSESDRLIEEASTRIYSSLS